MAPTTRSRSASSTPVRSSDAGTVTDTETDTFSTPTRKTPHCSKCHRPRAGHPRSGCPFTDSDEPTRGDSSDDSKVIEDALGSMTITPKKTGTETPIRRSGRRSLNTPFAREPVELEDTKKAIRERRKSQREAKAAAVALAPAESLASITSEDLEGMLVPADQDYSDDGEGLVSEEDKDEKDVKVVHWQDDMLNTPTKNRGVKEKMPGTFSTPSPWSSLASIPGDSKGDTTKKPLTQTSSTDSVSSNGTVSIEVVTPSVASSVGKDRTLARSMSMEERGMFMELLEEVSSAKAYLLSKTDLLEAKRWTPQGLHTKALVDEDGDQNVFIVGRDAKDTEALYERLNAERDKAKRVRRGSGNLKAAAGGAVVGAVATFTGLAFS